MSIVFDYDVLTPLEKRRIKKEYTLRPKKTTYNPNPQSINVFWMQKEDEYHEIHLPMGDYEKLNFASIGGSSSADVAFPHKLEEYPKMDAKFTFSLLTKETDPMGRGRDQDVLVDQVLKRLYRCHTAFIAAFTGFGKTSTAIYIVCHLGLKGALLCHNNTLKEQWKEEFLKFTGGKIKVQIVSGKKPLDPDADVYIIGVMKAAKMHPDDLINVGTVIIDEAHICAETAFTNALLKFRPMYLIGLSATPDRKDGLDGLMNFYFGSPKDYIVRTEVKEFTVFKYNTRYAPEPVYEWSRALGRDAIKWTKFISDLALIEERWKEIANIAISHKKNKIMILCDRQEMAKSIHNYLESVGESSELLIGTKKSWDKTKRVLVAGVKKGGTALNDPSLDLLIIAADTQDVRQMEGRIRQTNNVVYVMVDNHPNFERHWSSQRKWFLQRGASIYNIRTVKEAHHILKFGGDRDTGKRRTSASVAKRKVVASIDEYITRDGLLDNA